LRVIAGTYRSRALSTLRGVKTRPTSDRLRETLFNILTAGNPQALAGSVWVDLYAGTGAVGIEALSRGASMVHFVDSAPKAAELIRRNLQGLDIRAGFEVLESELPRALWKLQRRRVAADIVYLDPPYKSVDEYGQTLRALADSAVVWAMSLVIAEHDRRFDPGDEFSQLRRFRKTVQGDSALSFYRTGSAAKILL
jgi:16S rRNA (guanine966-N2)-methyltransferase